jgi:hypothetical protein
MAAAATIAAFLASMPAGAVCAVTGMPQTGKSRCLKDSDGISWSRRVVFDPYAERDLMRFNAGRTPAPPWSGVWASPTEIVRHRAELLDFEPCSVVIAPTNLAPEQLGEDFTRTAQACWRTGGITLIAEEAGLYSRACVPMLMQVASGGGHADMRVVLVSQSIRRLAIDARRHLSHLVMFAQGEAADLEDIRQRCGPELAERVRALRPGDAPITWRLGDAARRQ